MSNEAQARLIINQLLEQSGWLLTDSKDKRANVRVEVKNNSGYSDYILLDDKRLPLAIIEAKRQQKSPLDGKEQARNYAKSMKLDFVILTNGELHFLWNVNFGSPEKMEFLPTQEELLYRRNWNPPVLSLDDIVIDEYFLTTLVEPNIYKIMHNKPIEEKYQYLRDNNLKTLRYYQVEAVKAIANNVLTKGKSRFLLEMATGTGKTTTTAAIIKLFMQSGNATKVLFLVDRIELEDQAIRSFKATVSVPNGYTIATYKEDRRSWQNVSIVVSTIQSFIKDDRYKQIFTQKDFDLVITDEAHRCIGSRGRRVFEYFTGYKVGLTATPKDYLRGVDVRDSRIHSRADLERRELFDTYMIFDCATYNQISDSYDYEPTYKYDLISGVKDGYLLMPLVIDARTEKTTKILSEEGLDFVDTDDDGNEIIQNIKRSDFEHNFFNDKTNLEMCKAFLDNAKRDPISGEIGKSIIFCISQNHASKITQMLNQLADKLYPQKYQSDFAMQVTSNIISTLTDKKKPPTLFSENQLGGVISPFLDNYRTCKTRVCVTVAMMTTGYDCEDLLNVVLMRPIMSAIEFIQIKGRGTRKATFKYEKLDGDVVVAKDDFYLIDFFANYEYFENKDYTEIRKINKPTISVISDDKLSTVKNIINDIEPDSIVSSVKINVGNTGMKIDRELYKAWETTKIQADKQIDSLITAGNYDEAEKLVRERYENKPNEFITLDKIERTHQLDYKLTWKDVLNKIFSKLINYPTRQEKLLKYFDEFKQFANLDASNIDDVYQCFKLYVESTEFAKCVNNKDYAKLTQVGLTTQTMQKVGVNNFVKIENFASSRPSIFNLRTARL